MKATKTAAVLALMAVMMAVLVVGVVNTNEADAVDISTGNAADVTNALGNGTDLNITNQIVITGNVVWNPGSHVTINLSNGQNATAIVIKGGSLTVENITFESNVATAFEIQNGTLTLGENCILHGNKSSGDLGVFVNNSGSADAVLRIDGATIYGFQGHSFETPSGGNTDAGAVGVEGAGSVAIMTGGLIHGNEGRGAAVTTTNDGTFLMMGGTIESNTNLGNYGAVYNYGGDLLLAGGTIVNNDAGVVQWDAGDIKIGFDSNYSSQYGVGEDELEPLIIAGNGTGGTVKNLSLVKASTQNPGTLTFNVSGNLKEGSSIGLYTNSFETSITVGTGSINEEYARYFVSDRGLYGASLSNGTFILVM